MSRKAVLLVQLGSPASSRVRDVRPYLHDFLKDPRVVDLSPWFWYPILYLFVLTVRPFRSAAAYARIETDEGFPLIFFTDRFAGKIQRFLPDIVVKHCFILGYPSVENTWMQLNKQGMDDILVVPLFPQYADSTTGSVMDKVFESAIRNPCSSLHFMTDFYQSHAFIEGSVRQIEKYWCRFEQKAPVDLLIISFHGIPKRHVICKKDPYYRHCWMTFNLIKERLSVAGEKIKMTFQSRFGGEEWLSPYTDVFIQEQVRQNKKRVAVYCASFVADCLETLDEIGYELTEQIQDEGGEVLLIPALNDEERWCREFASHIKHPQVVDLKQESLNMAPELTMKTPPLSPSAKSTLKIVFLTLFLDLVGFSIIFPLFPALAEYYLISDGTNSWIQRIFGLIGTWADWSGSGQIGSLVLFGGALGALYSLLQFLAAPFWGALSDRIGRRPVLLISLAGLTLSYLLWIFSASFGLLLLARFIGGIMGGNISTATAVVADITQRENRAKGMAIIGIAFALGFILGPALGGLLSLIDLTRINPSLISFGINPFSVPALLAFVLSSLNLLWVARRFKESLPPEKRGVGNFRSANPLVLFKPLPYLAVNLVNGGHFLFLTTFSGMEFTLTFLAMERLGYTSFDNALMFIFIGVLIAIVQGGVVRRYAHQVGEKKMAVWGLLILIPGLVSIGYTSNSFILYLGLFFLSIGSAMSVACLTSLVSLFSPAKMQGQSLGIFRSLGALARVIGPIAASVLYWRMGGGWPYFAGAVSLLIPVFIIMKLPSIPKTD